MSAITVPHIVVIDPGVHTPEVDTFNHMCGFAPLPLTYHLPAMHGFNSFPTGESLALVRGIIVLGSAASVYENLPWQKPLEDWLLPMCERGVPVLGLCYGHQMLAHMFGGKIAYMTPGKEKLKGARQIDFIPNPLSISGSRRLIVTHNEAVVELPECMEILATSAAVRVDGLRHRKWPVFGLQSHPEATIEFLKSHEMHLPQVIEALPDGADVLRKFFAIIR